MLFLLLFPIGGFPEIYGDAGRAGFNRKLDSYFLEQIDADDKVSTISKYAPHLSERRHLTLFPDLQWNGEWADKILVDGKELVSREDRQALAELLYSENEGPDYKLAKFFNGIFLFEVEGEYPPWHSVISTANPPAEGLIPAEGGEAYTVGGLLSAGLDRFITTDKEIGELAGTLGSDLYWLNLIVKVDHDFDSNWFFAVRCEGDEGNPLFTYPHFPMYSAFYDKPAEPGEKRKAGILNRSSRALKEAYVLDPRLHAPRLVTRNSADAGKPARILVLPLELPDGWANTLDEYVTLQEFESKLNWEYAFVVDLNAGRR
jgi:hypothetical protein